jgi:hypothetical protein
LPVPIPVAWKEVLHRQIVNLFGEGQGTPKVLPQLAGGLHFVDLISSETRFAFGFDQPVK